MINESNDELGRIMAEIDVFRDEAERRRARGEFTDQEKKLREPLARKEIIERLSALPQARTEPVIASIVKRMECYPEMHESHVLLSAVEILSSALDEARKIATREAMWPVAPAEWPLKMKVAVDPFAGPSKPVMRVDYIDRDGNHRTVEGVDCVTTEPEPRAITGVTITRTGE